MTLGIYAIEVGQGDSHVILANRRAVLIDTGPPGSPVLPFLNRYVERLDALVLTHNDRDHCGAAIKILQEFGPSDRICAFWSLQDCAPNERANQATALACELQNGGHLKMFRLEKWASEPTTVARFGEETVLELLHPSYADSLDATGIGNRKGKGANRASAVLRLRAGERGIGVWSGDLPAAAWASLGERVDVAAQWFVVPHHGSEVGWTPARMDAVVASVRPRWSLLSVGTGNALHHPALSWIQTCLKYGAKVLCTQLTNQCHEPPEALKAGVLERNGSHPSPRRGVACAGTVVFRVADGTVLRLDEHQSLIDTRVGHPLCRRRH